MLAITITVGSLVASKQFVALVVAQLSDSDFGTVRCCHKKVRTEASSDHVGTASGVELEPDVM